MVTITHGGVPGGTFSEAPVPKNFEYRTIAKTTSATRTPQFLARNLLSKEVDLEERIAYGGGFDDFRGGKAKCMAQGSQVLMAVVPRLTSSKDRGHKIENPRSCSGYRSAEL